MRNSGIGILVATLLAAVPFMVSFELFYGAVNTTMFVVIGAVDVALLVAGFHYLRGKGKASFAKRPFLLSVLGCALVGIIAAFAGVFPEHSLWGDILRSTGVLYLLHLALLAYALGELLTERDWSLIRRTVTISAGAFSFLTILGAGGLAVFEKFLWLDLSRLGITFGNDTYAASYLLLAFLIGLTELARLRKGKARLAHLGSLALIAVSPLFINIGVLWGKSTLSSPFDFLGSARASSVALILFLAYLGLWWLAGKAGARMQVARRALAAFALALVVLGSGMLLVPGSALQETLRDETTQARFLVWGEALDAIGERPVLGWGPENFNQVFERGFNPELYEKEGVVEVWFDKAHNIVLDTLVSVGYLGALALLVALVFYARVVRKARIRDDISEWEALLLLSLPVVHFVQMQTAFDTVTTYLLIAVVIGYALSLERKAAGQGSAQPVLGAVLLGIALVSAGTFLGYEYQRQRALVMSVSGTGEEVHEDKLPFALGRTSDFEGLRTSVTLFEAGVVEKLTHGNQAVLSAALIRGRVYEEAFERYLLAAPGHYRVHMHYAYFLIYEYAWGKEEALPRALAVIERAYALSPDNPLTAVVHALALVYAGDIQGAEERIGAAQELSPDSRLVENAEVWLKKQKDQYPKRSFLFIGNI